jgi:hypothetical protein
MCYLFIYTFMYSFIYLFIYFPVYLPTALHTYPPTIICLFIGGFVSSTQVNLLRLIMKISAPECQEGTCLSY